MLPRGSRSAVPTERLEDKQRSWEVFIFSVGKSFSPWGLEFKQRPAPCCLHMRDTESKCPEIE